MIIKSNINGKKVIFNTIDLENGDTISVHTIGNILQSPISVLIRFLTRSYWNHTGIYNNHDIIEATMKEGVIRTGMNKYYDKKKYVLRASRLSYTMFADSDKQKRGIENSIRRAENSIGIKYDFGNVFFIGVKYLFKGVTNNVFKYFNKVSPFDRHRNKFFCSEFRCSTVRGISSIVVNPYQGKSGYDNCSTKTPKDIAKSVYEEYVTGYNVI